eukprot:5070164-Heterocapsa_arctica.AAC.1
MPWVGGLSACKPSAACRAPSQPTTGLRTWVRSSGRQEGAAALLTMRGTNSAVKVVWLGLVPNSTG